MFEVGDETHCECPVRHQGAGSATGELQGLRGEGTSAVGHGNEHPFVLNYDWE